MKSLKKFLAAFLAVLMVAFSVPFTALADEKKPNVHITAYDCYTINTSANIFWGQYDEETYQPLTGTIPADSFFVITFNLTGCTASIKGTNLSGYYDTTKITPATTDVTYDRRGNVSACTLVENTKFDNASLIDSPVTTNIFENTDGVKIRDGNSKMQKNGRFLIATSILPGAVLSGKTDYVYGYDPSINDYPDVYTVDGSLLGAYLVKAKTDINVDEIYDLFTFDITNDQLFFLQQTSGPNIMMTYGPLSEEPPVPSTETYTYTFADGSQTTVDANVGETPVDPANTADTAFVHDADATTHTKTTYAWTADGDKAFKEVGTPVTEDCDMQEVADSAVDAGHLTDGKKADTQCSVCGYTVTGETITAEGHKYVKTTVDPTCVAQGYDEYVCSVCQDTYKDNYTEATGVHDWKQTGSTGATCLVPGTVDYECSVCKTTKQETGALGDHAWREDAEVPATCTAAGVAAGKTCTVCGATEGYAEIPAKGHTDGEPVVTTKAPTCTEDGSERTVVTCTVCGATTKDETKTLDATGHAWVEDAEVPATCTEDGVAAGKTCSTCGEKEGYEVITAPGHDWTDVAEVPATRAEAGVAAGKICNVCDAKEGFEVIPALGVDITVAGSSLGTATVNGETIANAAKNVPYASAYTLTAVANDNAKFIGWKVGNKIVSTEATYTTSAYADMTYVPVFVEADSNAFTVTFVDSYGNVTATVESSQLPLAELPAAPSFAGLTFTGWDLTLEEVNALTASTTVTAKYENDAEKTYKVTAPEGCTIIVDGKEVASPAEVTYNTLVTVKAEGATAWTVNGSATPAAYGAEYAFYCGSDIAVAPVTDAVDAKPEVKAVSADKTATHQVTFLATRSVPEGFQLVESGFVYGKGMAAKDLVLENVGKVAGSANGTVKQVVCNNKGVDGQFSLTYGVKAMDATASAAAYLIYKDGAKSVVIYSDAMIFDYNA